MNVGPVPRYLFAWFCVGRGHSAGHSPIQSITALKSPSKQVWDTSSGRLMDTLNRHKGSIVSVVDVRDFVMSASADRSIVVWEAQSRQYVRTLLAHTGAVHSLSYVSAAVKPTFWSSSEDGTIRKWTFEVGSSNVERDVGSWLGLQHLGNEDEVHSPALPDTTLIGSALPRVVEGCSGGV